MNLNNNINALVAYNRFNAAGKVRDKVSQHLSSGLRITTAADDAAWAAISEKMKAQIRGLDQANKNIQYGISLIQTAESALGFIENPNLIRLRELVTQSMNDTLTQSDRLNIQKEIDNVKGSIDDIANNTEFNNIKLLSPPVVEDVKPPKWNPGVADIIFVIDRTSSMGDKIEKVKQNIDSFIDKIKANGVETNLGLVTYGELKENQGIIKKELTNDLDKFKEYINDIQVSGGGDLNESGLEAIVDSNNGALSYDLKKRDSAKQIVFITDAPVHEKSVDKDSELDIPEVVEAMKNSNVKLTVISNNSEMVKGQLEKLSKGTKGDYLDIEGNIKDQLKTYASKILTDAGCKSEVRFEDMPTLNLAVGPNSDEFEVKLFDSRTHKLGIKDLDILSKESREKAFQDIDRAMDKVSERRTIYGVYFNALEHIKSNGENYNYNLSLASSRIADADIAKEVMELTKVNIIHEAAQSVMIQSKNMQENILNLVTKWQGKGSGE